MASSSSEPSADSTSDLATLISKGEFDEVLLHQYADEGLLDIPDKEGRTPLMFACLKGLEDTVKFLLENGANPNSSCLKEGNTPMHYACTLEDPKGENVFRRRYCPWKWTDTKIPIIELLLSSGATERENLNGWTPLCVAAFYILMQVVDFFFYRDDAKIPLEVETKVTEILAVSDVICYPHFNFDIKHAFDRFSKAIGFRHRQGATRPKAQVETSELAACFLKMSLQECHTAEEIELIRESEVGLKVHAFLVGDRLYPKKLKQKYLYPSLVTFGCDLMWKLNMLEEGRQVLSCAIRFDHRGEFCLGSVVNNLARLCESFVKEDEGPNDQFCQYVQDLLCEIESILNREHIDSLSDHSDSLMDIFAKILFNEAFFCSTIDILRSTLQTIERSMLVIRGRIRVENPDKYHELLSVTYKLMDFLRVEFIGTLFGESDVVHSRPLLRVMFVIRKILFFDNVSYRDERFGNTLLHILLSNYFMSDPKHQEHFIDLAWALVRHGCPIDVNKDGETAKDLLLERKRHLEESDHRLLALVSPPTTCTVLSLEEIAIRQILRKNISYLGKIPTRLNGVIEGGLKDSDLERANDESDNDEERE